MTLVLALPSKFLPAAAPRVLHAEAPVHERGCKEGHPALFQADTVEDLVNPQGLEYNGLLIKRPFHGKYDVFSREIDLSVPRFGEACALTAQVANGTPRLLSSRLHDSVSALLAVAGLPPPLCEQIINDALSMGVAVGSMCPTARQLDIKLEIFGDNTCARWHQDHFVGRAIVSYNGAIGTEYTRDTNVDFWELTHCGNNKCIIRNPNEIESVGVGDMLFIKGTQFAGMYGGANGLVHKSPDKRYHADGRVVNRLALKVDVLSFGHDAEAKARATAEARAAEALAMRQAHRHQR